MRWAISCCSGSSPHEQLFSIPLNWALPESLHPFPPCSHWAPCRAILKLGSKISGAHLALSLQHEFRTPLLWQLGRGSVQYVPLFTGLFSDKKGIAIWPIIFLSHQSLRGSFRRRVAWRASEKLPSYTWFILCITLEDYGNWEYWNALTSTRER